MEQLLYPLALARKLKHQDCNSCNVQIFILPQRGEKTTIYTILSSLQTLESRQCFAMVQDCKSCHLDHGKHNCWDRVSRTGRRSSTWNRSLSSNSIHQILLHGIGWRYVSRQSTRSTSDSPRTSSWC